jgi:ATP-dependent RNA helicase DHX37/DHR1
VSWISQASAAQRAGRAGRTGPGHCYRLYSSSIFERHFEQFSQPEILRVPIEGIVLQMKSMHIDAVANFPFPTPPNRLSLKMAETSLTHLGALQYSKSDSKAWSSSLCFPRTGSKVTVGGHITELGKAMSLFPISPRYSKMLVAGRQHDILPYIITVVAALSVGSPFIHEKFIHDREQEGGDDAVSGSDLTIADDTPPEFRYIINQNLRDEELRKLERRRFFKSQEAR